MCSLWSLDAVVSHFQVIHSSFHSMPHMHTLISFSLIPCTLLYNTWHPMAASSAAALGQDSSKLVSDLLLFSLHLMVGKEIQWKLRMGSLHSPFVKSFSFSGLWRAPEAILQVSHSVSNLSSASEKFAFKIGLVTASFLTFLYPWDYFPQRPYLPVPQVCWSLLFWSHYPYSAGLAFSLGIIHFIISCSLSSKLPPTFRLSGCSSLLVRNGFKVAASLPVSSHFLKQHHLHHIQEHNSPALYSCVAVGRGIKAIIMSNY